MRCFGDGKGGIYHIAQQTTIFIKTQPSSLLSSEITPSYFPADNSLHTRLPFAMIPKEAKAP